MDHHTNLPSPLQRRRNLYRRLYARHHPVFRQYTPDLRSDGPVERGYRVQWRHACLCFWRMYRHSNRIAIARQAGESELRVL